MEAGLESILRTNRPPGPVRQLREANPAAGHDRLRNPLVREDRINEPSVDHHPLIEVLIRGSDVGYGDVELVEKHAVRPKHHLADQGCRHETIGAGDHRSRRHSRFAGDPLGAGLLNHVPGSDSDAVAASAASAQESRAKEGRYNRTVFHNSYHLPGAQLSKTCAIAWIFQVPEST